MKQLAALFLYSLSFFAVAAPQDHGVSYDIVYVRYPAEDYGSPYVTIPQGEHAYDIAPGADLMLLHPDGTETVLVNCDEAQASTCSVMDPFISNDGTTVYYSKILNVLTGAASVNTGQWTTAGYLYKIDLAAGAPYTEIQLTYPNPTDSGKYAGNDTAADLLENFMNIRDMAPIQLSDGRLMFTSNRSATVAFKTGTSVAPSIVQQIYVMDDHDGTLNTSALANMHRVEKANMHMAQHPIQLRDGRILFTTWHDFAHKYTYAMSVLFTMHPDGSNMKQFTEPHDHGKSVDHFVTQLNNDAIVFGYYYPSFDYGFGQLFRTPLGVDGEIQHLRESIPDMNTWANTAESRREFDRIGMVNMTPHTDGGDQPAPNLSGKYAMPSAAPNNTLLVAYSTGSVNHFNAACAQVNQCEALKSGIYLIKNATTVQVTDPTNTAQMVPLKDDLAYNEIWPRAVVPYSAVHGVSAPAVIKSVRNEAPAEGLAIGEAAAFVGTSSMLNRESSHGCGFASSTSRELHCGDWTIQGTDVGVFTDEDVWGVRILAIPEAVYTEQYDVATTQSLGSYFHDGRIRTMPIKFGASHNESWEILGEFPLTHKAVTDAQGNPDTSWYAKIPADTPTTLQGIDANGMTLFSETVWRSLAPGEERTDCGGCHAHSIPALDWGTTEAGKGSPITGVVGVDPTDNRISNGYWDLTTGTVPVVAENGGVEWLETRSFDVEFNRDIQPIFTANCVSCHTAGQSGAVLPLDTSDVWLRLNRGTGYSPPQVSKYIRSPQARESMLVWIAWGERLDGRTNATVNNDIDYPDAHPAVNLSYTEKRKIARWVDLGAPIDLPGANGFGYTDDNQLPTINIFRPKNGESSINEGIRVGITDAQSGVDWATLAITVAPVTDLSATTAITSTIRDNKGIIIADLPNLIVGQGYVATVTASDIAGNTETQYVRFVVTTPVVKPKVVNLR